MAVSTPVDNYTKAVSAYITKTNRIEPWPLIPEGTRRRVYAEIDEATGYQLSVWEAWAKVVESVAGTYPWWFGGTKKADNQAASCRRKFNARVFGGNSIEATEDIEITEDF
ncbi:protein of unknown function [Nitrospira defluvii]|jgi:hypothetical protein|uniref:Uncharacterized protein n=1 Tax=Nitrospira defluvii TaxID=330214 RepID=D8P9Q2_9BACT|nr:protein of unknown function [Nitrospira defluvii]